MDSCTLTHHLICIFQTPPPHPPIVPNASKMKSNVILKLWINLRLSNRDVYVLKRDLIKLDKLLIFFSNIATHLT